MKTLLVALLALTGLALAQQGGEVQHLLFVNAVPGEGRVFFEIGGEDINPAGHGMGVATGWLSMKAGEVTIKAEHDPLGVAELEVQGAAGSRQVVVAHRVSAAAKKEGRPDVKEVRLLQLDVQKLTAALPKGERILLLSVSEQEKVKVSCADKETELTRLHPVSCRSARANLFPAITARSKDGAGPESLATVDLENPGAQLVVVYDKADGTGLAATAISLGQ